MDLETWRINYELDRDPHDLADFWNVYTPMGAVLALKAAVEEIEQLQAQFAECADVEPLPKRQQLPLPKTLGTREAAIEQRVSELEAQLAEARAKIERLIQKNRALRHAGIRQHDRPAGMRRDAFLGEERE